MAEALKGLPEHSLERPPGIVEHRINRQTGLIASDYNPDAMFEKFDDPTPLDATTRYR